MKDERLPKHCPDAAQITILQENKHPDETAHWSKNIIHRFLFSLPSIKEIFIGQPLISFQKGFVFQKRSLNRMNTVIETHFYAL